MLADTRISRRVLAAVIAVTLAGGIYAAWGMLTEPLNILRLLPERPAAAALADAAAPTAAPVTPVAALDQPGPEPGRIDVPTTASQAQATRTTAAKAAANAAARTAATAAAAGAAPIVRLDPPAVEVQVVKQEVQARLGGFHPTANQIRQFSGQVCTAFDRGYSYAEVRTATLQAAARYPFLGVSSADADYAIHQAVNLYCPVHNSELR